MVLRKHQCITTHEIKSEPSDKFTEYAGCQKALKASIAVNNTEVFLRHIKNGADVNCRDSVSSYSVFEVACKTPGRAKFIKICIAYGARINEINPSHGQFPVHMAARSNDADNLLPLLSAQGLQIENQNSQSQTALFMLFETIIESNFNKVWNCIKLLLEYHANINTKKSNDKTPIQLVLENESLSDDNKKFILRYCLSNYYCYVDEKTKSLIEALYPGVKLTEYTEHHELFDQLRDILNRETVDTFIEICHSKINDIANLQTEMIRRLLQITIYRGKPEAAQKLLDLQSVDGRVPNYSTLLDGLLKKCCISGDAEMLRLLLDVVPEDSVDFFNRDPLLCVLQSEMGSKMEKFNSRFYECMEILLEDDRIEIDKRDGMNRTALELAGKYTNDRAQRMLLAKGAYVGGKDLQGAHVLGSINLDVLQTHLDSCVTGSDRQLNSMTLELNVMNFVPPKFKSNYKEHQYQHSNDQSFHDVVVALIEFMGCDSSAKKIILHPVILCLLNLKFSHLWFVQFMGIVAPMLLFCGLSLYASFLHEAKPILLLIILVLLLVSDILVSIVYLTIHVFSQRFRIKRLWVSRIIEVCFTLIVRVVSILYLFNFFVGENQQIVAAFILLASGIVVILALRTVSIFSIGPNILKYAIVLLNFLEYMIPFGMVLVMFAIGFYVIKSNNINQNSTETQGQIITNFDDAPTFTLMRLSNEALLDKFANITVVDLFKTVELLSNVSYSASSTVTHDDQFDTFENMRLALLKVAVMMTGELDSSEMHLMEPGFAIMFAMIVLGVLILFCILLNGSAVSDLANLREVSAMLGIREKLIMLYEWNIILRNLFRRFFMLETIDHIDTNYQRIIIELKPKGIAIKIIKFVRSMVMIDSQYAIESASVSKATSTNNRDDTEYNHSSRNIISKQLELALKEILRGSTDLD